LSSSTQFFPSLSFISLLSVGSPPPGVTFATQTVRVFPPFLGIGLVCAFFSDFPWGFWKNCSFLSAVTKQRARIQAIPHLRPFGWSLEEGPFGLGPFSELHPNHREDFPPYSNNFWVGNPFLFSFFLYELFPTSSFSSSSFC